MAPEHIGHGSVDVTSTLDRSWSSVRVLAAIRTRLVSAWPVGSVSVTTVFSAAHSSGIPGQGERGWGRAAEKDRRRENDRVADIRRARQRETEAEKKRLRKRDWGRGTETGTNIRMTE